MIELNELIDVNDFFENFWNRKKFHKTMSPLPEAEAIDLEFLIGKASGDPGYLAGGYVRHTLVSKEGNTPQEKQTIISDVSGLEKAVNEGGSLVFNHFQEVLPEGHCFQKLLSQLARATCSNDAQIAFFYTPGYEQGFVKHIDHNDFFTIQLKGEKKWQTYGKNPFYKRGEEGTEPKDDTILLAENDFLYLPRNTIHEVSGLGNESLSVSFILKTDTVLDVMVKIITRNMYRHQHAVALYDSYNPCLGSEYLNQPSIREIFLNL